MEPIYAVIAAFVAGQIGIQIRNYRLKKSAQKTLIETAPQRAIETISLVLSEQRKASEFAQEILKNQIQNLQAQIIKQQEQIQMQNMELINLRARVLRLEPEPEPEPKPSPA